MFDMRERCLGALVQLYNIEGLLVLTKVPVVHQSAWLLCHCSDHLACYLLEIVHLSREHLASKGPSDITALQSVLGDRVCAAAGEHKAAIVSTGVSNFHIFNFMRIAALKATRAGRKRKRRQQAAQASSQAHDNSDRRASPR
jgi:hypothetical protein